MIKKESELNKSLKLLAKSSFIVFIAVILSKILTYTYRIIVARHYGPEVYGLFALSLMIFGWFAMFSHFGFGHGVLRYISLYRGKGNQNKISYIIKSSLKLLAIVSVLFGILLFFLSDIIAIKIFDNARLSIFLKIFSFMIPLGTLNTVFFSIMKAYEKIGWFSFISKILDNSIKLFVLILLVFMGLNSINVPVSYLVGAIITFAVSYIYCRITFKKIFKVKPIKNKQVFRNVFSYSWPLLFFGFSMALLHQTDSFMIGIFGTISDVGFYNAAIPIALLLTVSVDLFNQLFFPLVTKEYAKGNKDLVKQLSQQTGKWVYMMSLPLFILFIIFPGVFIKLLFGTEYLVATNALRFLSIGAMFTTVFEVSKRLILMKGKSKLILKNILFVLALNIILNLILVPPYGINGAAIATMISFISLGLLFAFQSWKYLKIVPLRRKMIRITFVALISMGFLFLIKQLIEINTFTLIVTGVLFIAIYVILIFLTGCLDRNDKLIINLIKRKLSRKKSDFADLGDERALSGV